MLGRARRMGIGVGVTLTAAEDPISAAVMKYGGFWLDPDFPGALTLNTQPTIPGGGWAGASWAGSGLGPYTHTPGDTTDLANAALIVGNREQTAFTTADRTAGTVTLYAGTTVGTARSTNATFTEDLTCAGNTNHIFTPHTDFDGKVTVGSVANLSITTLTPRLTSAAFTGLTFTQATAANMPWKTSTTVNEHQTITSGYNTTVMSATTGAETERFFHDGTGCTIFTAFRLTSTAVAVYLGYTTTGVGIGYTVLYNSGGLYITVGNGSALIVNTAVSLGTGIHICSLRHSSSFSPNQWDLFVDGVVVSSGNYLASPSAGNSTTRLRPILNVTLAQTPELLEYVAISEVITNSDLSIIGKALAAKWGGTWA
jgi:hypothetical protein